MCDIEIPKFQHSTTIPSGKRLLATTTSNDIEIVFSQTIEIFRIPLALVKLIFFIKTEKKNRKKKLV